MTYDTVRRQLDKLIAVEYPLSEAWTRHAYEGTEFAEWLERVPGAGAAAMPREVLDRAVEPTAGLPETERDRLIVWFIVRMTGALGTIGPEDIKFEDTGNAE